MTHSEKKQAEVAKHMTFDIIRYSQLWEDSEILNKALAVRTSDRVLSISSAGCNVLSLLLNKPEAIIAIDLNPVQNGILALKLSGIKDLNHQEFIELIGLAPSERRQDLIGRLSDSRWKELEPRWPQHRDQIERGLPHEGLLDQYFTAFARKCVVTLPGIERLKDCFFAPMPKEQRRLASIFKDPDFKATFDLHFSQKMLEGGRDPAQFRYVEHSQIAEDFYKRLISSIENQPLFGNPYLYFVMFGETLDCRLGYDYARPENFATLRSAHDRVKIHTAPIEELLDHPDCLRVDKANLSNIFEYMSQDNMDDILERISLRMPPGGRVAFWNLIVDRTLSPALSKRFKKVALPEGTVDRVFFYKAFHVLERRG